MMEPKFLSKNIYIRPTHLQLFTKYPQATRFGPLGPSSGLIYEQVACGYFVKSCRCVGRMYIFYDNYGTHRD